MNMILTRTIWALLLCLLPVVVQAEGLIADKQFGAENEIIIDFATKIEAAVAGDVTRYTVYEENDPDIRLEIKEILLSDDGSGASIYFADPLNTAETHVVEFAAAEGEKTSFTVAKSYLGYLFSVLIAALLINNFVFTKYLGLCVFFGTSKRKSTAKGMGVVFTLVMVATGIMSWFFYTYFLKPYNLTNSCKLLCLSGLLR